MAWVETPSLRAPPAYSGSSPSVSPASPPRALLDHAWPRLRAAQQLPPPSRLSLPRGRDEYGWVEERNMSPSQRVKFPAARWAALRTVLFGAVAIGVTATAAQAQLGPPPQPAENPVTAAKLVLGKALFWDEQLSSDNTVACGTCHRPAQGGADPRFMVLAGPDAILGTADDVFGSPGVIRSDAANAFEPDPVHGFAPQGTGRNSPSFLLAAWADSIFWDGRASTTFIDPQSGGVSITAGGAVGCRAVGPPLSAVEMAHAGRGWDEIVAK